MYCCIPVKDRLSVNTVTPVSEGKIPEIITAGSIQANSLINVRTVANHFLHTTTDLNTESESTEKGTQSALTAGRNVAIN